VGEEPRNGKQKWVKLVVERELQSCCGHDLYKQLNYHTDEFEGSVNVNGVADKGDRSLPVTEYVSDQIYNYVDVSGAIARNSIMG
jgi:hypothetical protein